MIHTPRFVSIGSLILLLSITSCSYNPMNRSDHLTGSPLSTLFGGFVGLGTMGALGYTSKSALGFGAVGGATVGYYVSTLHFAAAGVVQGGGNVYTNGDYVGIEI